jgi:hypothetical protein
MSRAPACAGRTRPGSNVLLIGTFLCMFLAASLFIAGCGASAEPTKADYGAALRKVTSQLGALTGELGAAPKQSSTTARVARLKEVQLGVRRAGTQLRDITPPSSLATAHRDLVRAVQDMAGAVDLLIRAEQVVGTDPAAATKLLRRFSSDDSLPRVQAAAARITRAGVDAGF